MKILSDNNVQNTTVKTIKKNINIKSNNVNNGNNDYKPITSISANELGIYKTLLGKNNLSFGVKRIDRIAPNLTIAELSFYGLKNKNIQLSTKNLKELTKQFIQRNDIVTDYCLKLLSGEELEKLDTDDKCEEYINSQIKPDDKIYDNPNSMKKRREQFLNDAQNKLYEQMDAIYESISDNLPKTSKDINEKIEMLRHLNGQEQISIANNLRSSKKTTTYSKNNTNVRYLVLGELIKNYGSDFSETRINLFQICALATISSMSLDTFKKQIEELKTTNFKEQIEEVKTTNNKKIEIPSQILNILKGSEMVFSNFYQEEELVTLYETSINSFMTQVISDLKIRLLKKHLEIIQPQEKADLEASQKEYEQSNLDDLLADFGDIEQNVKNEKIESKKKKKNKKGASQTQASIEYPIQNKVPKPTQEKKETTGIELYSESTSKEDFNKNVEENGEFELVGVTLDNSLTELDSKKLFSRVDNNDVTHERYTADSSVVNAFYKGLINNEELNVNVKKHIKFNPKAEGDKHFVGAFLTRLKERNPNLKLSNAINILKDTLNEGVLVHSLTKGHNAKLDIYSIEHKIMIPFIMDEENQCIHLKTMLEFKDEDARESRYISNPRHDQLNGCCSLNKFDYNLRNNKDISIYLLPEVFEYKLRLLKVLFQKKY